MPTFGDFETVGEAFAVTDERTHVSTIWQVRKPGESGPPTFALKCYAPRRATTKAGQPEDTLDEDRSLEFLEGVKQLKKAYAEGGRCLAPIHELGISSEGAWFVTNFYPGKTLREFIAKRGRVDSAALRHILHSILIGCLALKKSRGFSHGNLKTSNVFLAGRPRPLRRRPFHLTDAYPAAPIKLGALEGADKRTVNELLHQVMEVQDLRALGELILQLVEGRLVTNSYDYNYPIAHTPAWEQLGGDAQRWRQRCNRLLDPQLSLESVNLKSLEKELRPSQLSANLPKTFAAAAVGCVLCAGVYFTIVGLGRRGERRRVEQYQKAYGDAQQALSTANFSVAQQRVAEALKLQPNQGDALQLKARIEAAIIAEKQRQYANATNTAGTALRRQDFREVTNQAAIALSLIPGDPMAGGLLQLGRQGIASELVRVANQRSYESATNAADAALRRQDFREATNQAGIALRFMPGDSAAGGLMQAGQNGLLSAQVRAENETKYATATNQAGAAFRRGEFRETTNQAGIALGLKPGDPMAVGLMRAAQQRIDAESARLANETKYATATNAAGAALLRQDFRTATNQAGFALGLKPGDAMATGLLRAGQEGAQAELARQAKQTKFETATNAAAQAWQRQDFRETTNQAGLALAAKPGDATANALLRAAQQALQSESERRANQARYETATNAAGAALLRHDYPETTNQAGLALALKPGDVTATSMMQAALQAIQAEQTRIANQARYETATNTAGTALREQNYREVTNQAAIALLVKAGDPMANGLMQAGQQGLQAELARLASEARYQSATNAAGTALRAQNFVETTNHATVALLVKPGDPMALSLMQAAQQGMQAQAVRLAEQAKYEAATNAAGASLRGQKFAETTNHANIALLLKPGDAVAVSLMQAGQQGIQADILRLANQARFETATNAAGAALQAENFQETTNQASKALLLHAGDPTAGNLMQAGLRGIQAQQEKIEADLARRHPPATFFGMNFIWVRGAYFAVNELSWSQYAALSAQSGQTPKILTEDSALPATILNYSNAVNFVSGLNNLPSPTGQGTPKGLWRLPTLEEYKTLTDSQIVVGADGSWTLPDTVFDTVRDKENMAGSKDATIPGKRQQVIAGVTNAKGLRYVLGNVREWAVKGTEGVRFGVSYLSEGRTARSKVLNSTAAPPPSEAIGIRLVYQPPG